MQLRVRHLTGSRAGELQTFDTNEVTIGRHPSSMILFDPQKDRVVSGKHAALLYENNRWVLRDLGSSNGTFIGGDPVSERIVQPGDVIQLGKNGPQVQLEFESEEIAPTVVVPLTDLKAPQAPREGKTLIMMMPGAEGGTAPPVSANQPAGAAYAGATPRKKGGMGKALAIVAAVLVLFIVGAAALAFVVRSSNVKKKKAIAAKKTGAASSQTATLTAQEKAEAERLNNQIAQQQQQIAQTQATLEKTQQAPGAATNQEAEDLKRQLAESQALLEQMTRQLQEKNDQITAAQSRPAPQPQVRYVPMPTAAPTAAAKPKPVAPTASPSQSPAAATSTSASPAAQIAATPATPLYTGKKLKKKVLITPLPPEIPPANLPNGTARDLANLLTSALVSTGDFVVGPKGQASVSVMVTNYRADVKKTVDTKKTADSARKLGKIFGQSVPANPVDVKSVAYDAAMSVRVKLYDPTGRVIAEVEPSAQSSDRKTKSAVAGVSFHEVALSDTAVGDVARKVIGDTIDTVRNGLTSLDWSTVVSGQTKEKLTLASGRNANLEPGDVFEVMDGGKAVARVRVTSVSETSAEAQFIGAAPKAKVSTKMARYVGSENAVSTASRERSLTVRIKTSAYDGPGDSFNAIRELKVGQKLKFHYSVGAWARASDGGSSFWVPMAKVQVTS